MDIKIHDTFFENMCCKKSAKEYEKFILRCGISVKSENAIQIMPDRTADITFKISLSVMQTPFKYISDNQHTDISAMSIYFCGGSCIEDVTTHLMNHLSLHPTDRKSVV